MNNARKDSRYKNLLQVTYKKAIREVTVTPDFKTSRLEVYNGL